LGSRFQEVVRSPVARHVMSPPVRKDIAIIQEAETPQIIP
jgi:hypothetical protein